MTLVTKSEQKAFNGTQGVYTHSSESTQCEMEFSLFTPNKAKSQKCPVLYYLSGLTCTQENVTTKSGFQKYADEAGVFIVCPDTSPRGTDLPEEHVSYDFGSGAGFYLNATQSPWDNNYKMYDYIVNELPLLIQSDFNIDKSRAGIFGHSMGGHGALTIGLKNPSKFKSISAFSPIVAPTQCAWGQKAFSGYLGDNQALWQQYDACELISSGLRSEHKILVDQGLADDFLEEQLKPQLFEDVCKANNQALELRYHEGYDHSYFFIATFIEDHIKFHANNLG